MERKLERERPKELECMSAEHFRGTIAYETEDALTHSKLQELPDQMKRLTREVSGIRKEIEAFKPGNGPATTETQE